MFAACLMRKILNLTQHPATPDQVAAGVLDPNPERAARIRDLLTFEALPTEQEIHLRAHQLYQEFDIWSAVDLDEDCSGSPETWPVPMIGGAPYLMGALELAFAAEGTGVLYAFSRRESVETVGEDGTTRKTAVFRHLGFVEMTP
jgi:hypothetical protein